MLKPSPQAAKKQYERRPYLNLPDETVIRIRLLLPVVALDSFSQFVRQATLEKLRTVEAQLFGNPVTRVRLMLLSFVHQGCRSVEDIKYTCQSLLPAEIELHLFALEQEGCLIKKDAKRGRTWQWELSTKGEERLKEKGLLVE